MNATRMTMYYIDIISDFIGICFDKYRHLYQQPLSTNGHHSVGFMLFV